jgi:hypothetical protein
MQYPKELIRGITNNTLLSDGYAGSALFSFQETLESENRSDDFLELSINWRDDDGAIELLMNQKKNEHYQFASGVALIKRRRIDQIRKSRQMETKLSYERQSIPENPYHGNLLLHKSVDPQVKKIIQATIACECEIQKNPNIS